MHRRLRISELGAVDPHPVGVIPLEVPGCVLSDQVAAGIVGVGVGLRADGHRGQAVVLVANATTTGEARRWLPGAAVASGCRLDRTGTSPYRLVSW